MNKQKSELHTIGLRWEYCPITGTKLRDLGQGFFESECSTYRYVAYVDPDNECPCLQIIITAKDLAALNFITQDDEVDYVSKEDEGDLL
jgi:hypothetical protein